jgi:alpha-N-acetylglucosamine transferase
MHMTPVLAETLEAELIEGEMVIYNSATEAAVHLNQTGTLVYQLIDGERSTTEIVEILSEAFPDADIESDVATLMTELAKAKVISYA